MTTHGPRHIHREDVLRQAWWLNIILVVVWGMDVVVGGWVEFWHSPRVGFEMTCQPVFKRSPITKGRFLFCYQNVRAKRRRVGVIWPDLAPFH